VWKNEYREKSLSTNWETNEKAVTERKIKNSGVHPRRRNGMEKNRLGNYLENKIKSQRLLLARYCGVYFILWIAVHSRNTKGKNKMNLCKNKNYYNKQ
jgi:hypothetical protein